MQLAKREMQSLARNRAVWVGVLAAGTILGLAGPFGTDEVMQVVLRVAYWIFLMAVTFFAGSAAATYTAEGLRAAGLPRWPAIAAAGAVAGLVNFGLVLLINVLIWGRGPVDGGYLLSLGINIVIISIIIAGAYVAIEEQIARNRAEATPAAGTPAPPAPPRLLERLPLDKRGPLVALSVQDHYVEVATTRGTELVLLRLGDAMAETGDTPGLQVHRSHWIATGEVTAVRRDGARAMLTMSNGRDIPVSRTYLPAIKEAGLLPK